MRVLIDTNIILDFVLERERFLAQAESLFHVISTGAIVGYVTATTLTDIFYIARRSTQNIALARQIIINLLTVMEVCPVDRIVVEVALTSGVTDFEDAVQVACAIIQGLDAIVTRDATLVATSIPIWSIDQVLQQLE